jgi:small GTP-binding protein
MVASDPKPARTLKILSVGNSGVGKTNLIMVSTGLSAFTEEARSTIGVQFSTKNVVSERGYPVNVQIWDTAGQERYRALTSAYYRYAPSHPNP